MNAYGNGNSTQSFLEESLAYLSGRTTLSYYREGMPSRLDDHIDSLVRRSLELPAAERDRWLASMPAEARSLFGIYSHRAATMAASEKDVERLRSAVIAAVITNFFIPEKRNVDPLLALLHHVARRLETDPAQLFREAAEIASEEMATHLHDFSRREDVVLSQFGWREIKTPDGVQYKFDWR